jgi:hypothetical protein
MIDSLRTACCSSSCGGVLQSGATKRVQRSRSRHDAVHKPCCQHVHVTSLGILLTVNHSFKEGTLQRSNHAGTGCLTDVNWRDTECLHLGRAPCDLNYSALRSLLSLSHGCATLTPDSALPDRWARGPLDFTCSGGSG